MCDKSFPMSTGQVCSHCGIYLITQVKCEVIEKTTQDASDGLFQNFFFRSAA